MTFHLRGMEKRNPENHGQIQRAGRGYTAAAGAGCTGKSTSIMQYYHFKQQWPKMILFTLATPGITGIRDSLLFMRAQALRYSPKTNRFNLDKQFNVSAYFRIFHKRTC